MINQQPNMFKVSYKYNCSMRLNFIFNKLLICFRLASSLLARQQSKQHHPHQQQQEPAVTPEIQSSIKEVTSAIVHFVNDQTQRTSNSRSRSTSPTTRYYTQYCMRRSSCNFLKQSPHRIFRVEPLYQDSSAALYNL